VRHGAQAGDIFKALVAGAQRAVDQAGAVTDEHHRQLLVADINLDLLEHPHRNKRTQAIHDRPKARLGQTRCDAHHVLLGNAGVDVLAFAGLAELVKKRVAVIAGEQQHARVLSGCSHQCL
jgi:hypothetical protein